MKKYSKLIALASVIVIAILVTVLVVYFNSIEKGNNFQLGDYTVVAQGAGVAIVKYDGEETELKIPASIEGKKIVAIKQGAFNDTPVVKITFAEKANVEIEESAFANNTTIQSIDLPSNLTSIAKSSFNGCTSLTTITMPDSITYIGEGAFSGCTSLTQGYEQESGIRWLNLPKSLTEICESAFYNCTELDGIRVSDKLVLIDNYAFGKSGLQKIALYQVEGEEENVELSITEIGDYAFYQTQLRLSLKMPALTKIGKFAFASILSNTTSTVDNSFIMPASVTSVGDYAFSGCSDLIAFTFESNPEGDKDLELGKGILSSCIALNSVTFNRSVKAIPEETFKGCISLLKTNDLTLPEELQTIGDYAFALFDTSSSSTKYCNKTINFKREGYDTAQSYNDFFQIVQLAKFDPNGNTSYTSKHFVITDAPQGGGKGITTLYAYVGLFKTDSSFDHNTHETKTFLFFDAQNDVFGTMQTIKKGAFAGAQFKTLCLPGKTTYFEERAFVDSQISEIYIDSTCVSYSSEIDKNAFTGMKTDIKDLVVFILGSASSGDFAKCKLKEQLDAIQSGICLLSEDAEFPI